MKTLGKGGSQKCMGKGPGRLQIPKYVNLITISHIGMGGYFRTPSGILKMSKPNSTITKYKLV